MKKYTYNNINYELIKEYKNGFEDNEVKEKLTDFFIDYDYILGDWAYSKLRLKGFNEKTNEKYSKVNDYERIDEYIKNHCAYECRYFILKKSN